MHKLIIILIILPWLLFARNDTITIYRAYHPVQKNEYTPGVCKIYYKNGKVDVFKCSKIKMEKLSVPVNDDNTIQSRESNVFPQPFTNIVNIEFQVLNDSYVYYEIYNQSGVKVFFSNEVMMQKGRNTIQWGGIDNDGLPVPNGKYYLKIKNDDNVINEKLVLIK